MGNYCYKGVPLHLILGCEPVPQMKLNPPAAHTVFTTFQCQCLSLQPSRSKRQTRLSPWRRPVNGISPLYAAANMTEQNARSKSWKSVWVTWNNKWQQLRGWRCRRQQILQSTGPPCKGCSSWQEQQSKNAWRSTKRIAATGRRSCREQKIRARHSKSECGSVLYNWSRSRRSHTQRAKREWRLPAMQTSGGHFLPSQAVTSPVRTANRGLWWLLYWPRKRRGEPSADFGCQPFGALEQGIRRELATCGERHESVKQLQSCPGCLSKGKEREKAVYHLGILLVDFSVCARKTLWRIFCVVSCWWSSFMMNGWNLRCLRPCSSGTRANLRWLRKTAWKEWSMLFFREIVVPFCLSHWKCVNSILWKAVNTWRLGKSWLKWTRTWLLGMWAILVRVFLLQRMVAHGSRSCILPLWQRMLSRTIWNNC